MYLFFIRAFNDVDHLTPIVWKMSRDNYRVAVYCINPEYDIQNDYRLNFLKNAGVTVDSIYDNFDEHLGTRHRVMRFLFQRSFALQRKLDMHSRPFFSFLSGKISDSFGINAPFLLIAAMVVAVTTYLVVMIRKGKIPAAGCRFAPRVDPR
jgi:flagellar assembly factor FliW